MKLHAEELHDLCQSPDIVSDQVKEKQVSGASEAYEGGKKCMQCLVGKPEGRKPCGRSKRGQENNIAMDLK
jgi:hypothetical protein